MLQWSCANVLDCAVTKLINTCNTDIVQCWKAKCGTWCVPRKVRETFKRLNCPIRNFQHRLQAFVPLVPSLMHLSHSRGLVCLILWGSILSVDSLDSSLRFNGLHFVGFGNGMCDRFWSSSVYVSISPFTVLCLSSSIFCLPFSLSLCSSLSPYIFFLCAFSVSPSPSLPFLHSLGLLSFLLLHK